MSAIRNAVAGLGLVLLLLPVGAAQAEEPYPVAGQVYLSFVPDGRVQDLQVTSSTPFDFYLIVDLDLAGGDPYRLSAIEGRLEFSSEIFLSNIDWAGGTWANVGEGLAPGSYDFVTATSSCLELSDGPNVLCTFRGVLLEDANDLFVGIGPAATSSFGGLGPGWVTCDDFVGYLFEPNGVPRALSINNTLGVDNSSWSRIKTLYRN
jgi:hypothetical protein